MNLRTPSALIGAVALVALAAPAALADPTTTPTATGTAATATAVPSPVTTTATATTTAAPTETTAPTATTTTAPPTTDTAPVPTTTAPAPTTTAPAPTGTATASATTSAAPKGQIVPGGRTAAFGPRAPQGVITNPTPEEAAAGYLARELAAGGHHFSVDFGGTLYPDYGVTADAVLALDAAGAGQTEAAAATQYLAANVGAYAGTGGEVYSGAVAKLLNVAAAQGVDPTAFGGVDLVATLQSLEQPTGQFADASAFGDYSNLFGQALALMGLQRTGNDPSPTSVAFLTAQQCADGGFRLYFGAEPCASDPDATAMAVQALIAVNGTADANAVEGLDYLAGRQAASGGVGGGGPTAAVNANSTGLAGQAFLAGGRAAQARLANQFLANLQYDCTFPGVVRGGVAYDAAAFAAQRAAGSGATTADQDRRSTTQAILSLAGTPLYAVTATGAVADGPAVVCAAPTVTTSTTTTAAPTTTTTTTSASATSTGTTSVADPSTTTGGDPLAYTGAQALPLGALAIALLGVGSVLVLLSRRRGTHA